MANKISSQLSQAGYYLYIDGVSSRDLQLRVLSRENSNQTLTVAQGSRTELILPTVRKFISKLGCVPAGLAVVNKGGSFTQARLVCVIANALAYAWRVKVVAVPAGADRALVDKLLKKTPANNLVLPQYYGPGVN